MPVVSLVIFPGFTGFLTRALVDLEFIETTEMALEEGLY